MRLITSLLIISFFVLLTGFQLADAPNDASISKEGMIKVTILYPNTDGNTFDMEYYKNTHMPLLEELLGKKLKRVEIDKGISGAMPDDPIPYVAIGYLYFDRLTDYYTSFAPNADKIIGDIPNYTNIEPIVQISQVLQ